MTTLSDVWIFGQNDCEPPFTWQNATNGGVGPAARASAGFANDQGYRQGSFVLFGGIDSTGQTLSDTWIFDPSVGPSWTTGAYYFVGCGYCYVSYTMQGQWGASSLRGPVSGREAPSLAFEGGSTGGSLLLFGGYNGATSYSDLWTWTCTSGNPCTTWVWTLSTPATSPGARGWGMMGPYSAGSAAIVLFGGYDPFSGTQYADTWAYP